MGKAQTPGLVLFKVSFSSPAKCLHPPGLLSAGHSCSNPVSGRDGSGKTLEGARSRQRQQSRRAQGSASPTQKGRRPPAQRQPGTLVPGSEGVTRGRSLGRRAGRMNPQEPHLSLQRALKLPGGSLTRWAEATTPRSADPTFGSRRAGCGPGRALWSTSTAASHSASCRSPSAITRLGHSETRTSSQPNPQGPNK